MLILGKLRQWKKIPIEFLTEEEKAAGREPQTVNVFIEGMSETERTAILTEIEPLKETDELEWQRQLLSRFGRATIKRWVGVGSCNEDGTIEEVPVTPEAIDAFMEQVGVLALTAINDVNAGLVTNLEEAGNA